MTLQTKIRLTQSTHKHLTRFALFDHKKISFVRASVFVFPVATFIMNENGMLVVHDAPQNVEMPSIDISSRERSAKFSVLDEVLLTRKLLFCLQSAVLATYVRVCISEFLWAG